MDEIIDLKAEHLNPGDAYSILVQSEPGPNVTRIGVGNFVADTTGTIDLGTSASSGGSYSGVQPMGVITHSSSRRRTSEGESVLRPCVTHPLTSHFKLLQGHHTVDSAVTCQSPLASTEVARNCAYSDVTRLPVREGRVRGALFVPEGPGPYPAVLDMWGSMGGLIESRAAMFAARGILTLVLAFCNYDDLPKDFSELELEYFLEALDVLLQQPGVDRERVGVVGASKGSEFALALAAHAPAVKKCVTIGGVHFLWESKLKYKGQLMVGQPHDMSNLRQSESGHIRTSWAPKIADIHEKTIFPVENNPDCEILWITGTDDETQPAVDCGRDLQERLVAKGQGHRIRLLELPGAGHLIQPPYTPFYYSYWHTLCKEQIVSGGEVDSHAAAQLEAWKQQLQFLHAKPFAA